MHSAIVALPFLCCYTYCIMHSITCSNDWTDPLYSSVLISELNNQPVKCILYKTLPHHVHEFPWSKAPSRYKKKKSNTRCQGLITHQDSSCDHKKKETTTHRANTHLYYHLDTQSVNLIVVFASSLLARLVGGSPSHRHHHHNAARNLLDLLCSKLLSSSSSSPHRKHD